MNITKIVLLVILVISFINQFQLLVYANDTNENVVKNGNPAETIKITWFGHSMFLVELNNIKVVFDPFSDIGYPMPYKPILCDICITSHNHFDHTNTKLLSGAYVLRNSEGEFNDCGLNIKMIKSFHDKNFGKERGINLVSIITYNGIKIAHLGDLGSFDNQLINELNKVDILMIPIGGYYTIDSNDAWELIRNISPKIIIPMHYKTTYLDSKFPIDTIDKFISGRNNIVSIESNSCEIKLNSLPKTEQIYLFKI